MKEKILYAGWGNIGVTGLMYLLADPRFNISDLCIIIDQSDNSYEMRIIKDYAERFSIDIKFINELEFNTAYRFELCISVHWRKKISSNVISLCEKGGANLHPSLLPKYAGCSSLAWSILNNENYVGYSWHMMENNFDSGKIILQEPIELNSLDTAFSLWNKVNLRGVSRVVDVINICTSENPVLLEQNIGERTYFKRGFPQYAEAKKIVRDLNEDLYKRASYFPGKG